jgi:CBS domain-containing protein
MLLADIARAPISQVPTREPVRVAADAHLGDVVDRIHTEKTGAALVVDGNDNLIGVFTEHDLLRRIDLRSHSWREKPVSAFMTQRPRVIREEDTIAEAMRRMEMGRHRHLPVVRGEKPVAVVSVRDLLAYLASKFPADFINLPPDPDREARGPWGG